MVAIGAFSRQDKGKQVVVEVKADGDQSGGRCFRDGGLGDERRESSDGDSLPTRSPSPGRDKVKSTTSRTLSVRALLIGAVVGTSVLAFIAWDRRQSSRDWSASAQQLGELFQFNRPTSGGNGSLIRMENGESFVYLNNFGGTWDATVDGLTAKAQNFTPPLSELWNYETMSIRGVNLGGWLTLEPFITPALFEPFLYSEIPAVDEWTLSLNLGDQLSNVLEEHYRTFITEKDFADIAGAGLQWVRIPLPFWAIEVYNGEPFLPHVSWNYFLKAVTWARKYGLRINLDLHAVPGSQNGWNHSGKSGKIGFLNGVMGIANAQRTLNYIRALSDFISLPGNSEVIPMFGILNEPFQGVIGAENLRRFYYQAYETVRNASGLGEGHGPMISLHDGFKSGSSWFGFLEGADRVALDSHFYLAFREPNDEALLVQALKPCTKWASAFNKTLSNFGVAIAGEWSLGVNDCGRFLNGVEMGHRYDGTFPNSTASTFEGVGSCEEWDDYTTWTIERKQGLRKFALASMDTARNSFFWTWKTGITLTTNRPASPLWSYSLGLSEGFVPLDPREAPGTCNTLAEELGVKSSRPYPWDGTLQPWQIGGPGAGKIAASQVTAWEDFPPTSLAGGLLVSTLSTYTATGPPLILPIITSQSPSPLSLAVANWYAPVADCKYEDPWDAVDKDAPTFRCPEQL